MIPLNCRLAQSPFFRNSDKFVDIFSLYVIKTLVLVFVKFFRRNGPVVPALALEIPLELFAGKDPALSGVDLIDRVDDFLVRQRFQFLIRVDPGAADLEDVVAGQDLLFLLQLSLALGFFLFFFRFFLFLLFRSLLCFLLRGLLFFFLFRFALFFLFLSLGFLLFALLLFGCFFFLSGLFLRLLLLLLRQFNIS